MNTPLQFIISKTRGKKRHYTIDMGANGTATIQYQSAFCKNAIGFINEKEWKFIRRGFWKIELEITGQQSPYTKTHIKFGWSSKMSLRAPDNNMYHFKAVGFWRKRWIWYDAAGQQLMEIKSNGFSRSRRGIVTLNQPWNPTLAWLLMVGWFQLVIWEEQTAAAVAAAS
jgi:hypothetical protein